MQNLKDIPCLILGIGNILWADEGFGVRVVEAFNDKYAFTDPNNVIADGGTLGMYLYDLLVAAAVRGAIPNDIAVVGFQPVLLDDYGGSLSAEAKGKVDEAVRDGYEIVRGWNVGLRVRSEDEMAPALMDAPCLNIDQYESGRPSAEEACRDGDIRFARFVAKADK